MTREEAIDKVRAMKLSPGKDAELIIALHTLIPELRESEDERIRKWLIDDIKLRSIGWTHSEFTGEQILAWLEKQKEQKPAEWSEDWREEDIQTRFAFYTYKDDPSVLYLSNVFVEEASRNHGFGTRILRAAEKVAETIGATTISLKVKQDSPANAWYRKNGYGYVAFEDGYDWLEKNLEYMKPNKQEWSEEDEQIAKEIEEELWYPGNFPDYPSKEESELYDDCQRRLNWFKDKFKSLRPQPKQEWNKEDERNRDRAIFYTRFYQRNEGTTKGSEECIDWLKSLRPQPQREWSEEDEKIANEDE